MPINDYTEMDPIHLSVLREIGNIGSGNAATALSAMLDRPVNIGVPRVEIMDYAEITELLGGPEEKIIGMLITLSDDINGMMLFLLKRDFAHVTINDLLGVELNDYDELDEIGKSMLNEVGNIMSGSYISALASFTNLKINISTPSLTEDMLGSILSVPAIHFADISDKIILIGDGFDVGDNCSSNTILLMPDIKSLDKIMESLGMSI